METRIFLDHTLDNIEGPTTDYFRRERYRTWHVVGDSWASLYGEQLLKDLATNFTIAIRHNVGLLKTKRRIKNMILYRHVVHTKEMHLSLKDLKLVETWDSEAWCRVWPDGMTPLSTRPFKNLGTERQVIYREYMRIKPRLEELLSDVSWWALNAAPNGMDIREKGGRIVHATRAILNETLVVGATRIISERYANIAQKRRL
jgi:hypothetical protein